MESCYIGSADFDIIIMTLLALSSCTLGAFLHAKQAKRYYLGK